MADLRTLVEEILDGETIASEAWGELSALADERAADFRAAWDELSGPARLGLLDSLHTEAELSPHLDFTPIWRLAIDDPAPKVRRAGIEYSADEDGDWLVELLLARCAGDPDPTVRAAAAEALGRFAYLAEVGHLPDRRGQQIEAALLAALGRGGEPVEVRAGALASVGYLSTPPVREAILAGHADSALRPSAVRAMGRNCDPRWTETLLADTRSRQVAVRQEAARAIGEIEDSRGTGRLLDLLEDPALAVRLAAIWALGEIGGEEAQEALMFCLDDTTDAIREAAEAALAEIAERENPLGL